MKSSDDSQIASTLLTVLQKENVEKEVIAGVVNNYNIIKKCIEQYVFSEPYATNFIEYLRKKIYNTRGLLGLGNGTHSDDVKNLLLLLLQTKEQETHAHNTQNNDQFEAKLIQYCAKIGHTEMLTYLQQHFKYYAKNAISNATGVGVYNFLETLNSKAFLNELISSFSSDFKITCEHAMRHGALENLTVNTLRQYLKAIAFSNTEFDTKRQWVSEALQHNTFFPDDRFKSLPHSHNATIEDIILLFLVPLLEGDKAAIEIGRRKLNIESTIIDFIPHEQPHLSPNDNVISNLIKTKDIIELRKAIAVLTPEELNQCDFSDFDNWINLFTLLDTLVYGDDLLALFATHQEFQSLKMLLIERIQLAFSRIAQLSLSPKYALTLLGYIAPYYALAEKDIDCWHMVYKQLDQSNAELMQKFFNIVARWIEPSCTTLLDANRTFYKEFFLRNSDIYGRKFDDWDNWTYSLNYRPYKLSLGIITRLDQLKKNSDQYERYKNYYQNILQAIYAGGQTHVIDPLILRHLKKHALQPFQLKKDTEQNIRMEHASANTMEKKLSSHARELLCHPDYPRELRDMMMAGNFYNFSGLKAFLEFVQKIPQPTCFQELFIADLFQYFISQCFNKYSSRYLILCNLMLPQASFLRCSVFDTKYQPFFDEPFFDELAWSNQDNAENIGHALLCLENWTKYTYFDDEDSRTKAEKQNEFIWIIQACIDKVKASRTETNELLDYLLTEKMTASEVDRRRARFLINLLQNILSLDVKNFQTFHNLRTCIDEYKKGSNGGTHLIAYTEKLLFAIAEKETKTPLHAFENMYLSIKSEHLNPMRQDCFVAQLKTIIDGSTFIDPSLRDYIKSRVNPTHIEYWVKVLIYMMSVQSSDFTQNITFKDYLLYLQQYNNDNHQLFVAEEMIALLHTEMLASYFNVQPGDIISANIHTRTVCDFLINKIKEQQQVREILQILLADRFILFVELKAMGAINSISIDNDEITKGIEKMKFLKPSAENVLPTVITDDADHLSTLITQLDSQSDQLMLLKHYNEAGYASYFKTRDYFSIEIAALLSPIPTLSPQHLWRILNHLYFLKNIPEQQARECVEAILKTEQMKDLIWQHFIADDNFVKYLHTKLDAKHLHDVIGFLCTLANETLRNASRNTFESRVLNHCMNIGKMTMSSQYIPAHLSEQGLEAIYAINIEQKSCYHDTGTRLRALHLFMLHYPQPSSADYADYNDFFFQIHDFCLNNYEGEVKVTEKLMDFLLLRFQSNDISAEIWNAYIAYLKQPDPIFSKYCRFETEFFPSFIYLHSMTTDLKKKCVLLDSLSTIVSEIIGTAFTTEPSSWFEKVQKQISQIPQSDDKVSDSSSQTASSSIEFIEFNNTLAQQLWNYKGNLLAQRCLMLCIQSQQANNIAYWNETVTVIDNQKNMTVTRLEYILKLLSATPRGYYAFLDCLQKSIYSSIKQFPENFSMMLIVQNLLLINLAEDFLRNDDFKNDFAEYYQQQDNTTQTTRCEIELIPNLLNRLQRVKKASTDIQVQTRQLIAFILICTGVTKFDPITLQWLNDEGIDVSHYTVRQCSANIELEQYNEIKKLAPDTHRLYDKLLAESLYRVDNQSISRSIPLYIQNHVYINKQQGSKSWNLVMGWSATLQAESIPKFHPDFPAYVSYFFNNKQSFTIDNLDLKSCYKVCCHFRDMIQCAQELNIACDPKLIQTFAQAIRTQHVNYFGHAVAWNNGNQMTLQTIYNDLQQLAKALNSQSSSGNPHSFTQQMERENMRKSEEEKRETETKEGVRHTQSL